MARSFRCDNLKDFPREDLILIAGEAPGIKASLIGALTVENFRVKEIPPEALSGLIQEGGKPSRQWRDTFIHSTPVTNTVADRVGGLIHFAGFPAAGASPLSGPESSIGLFSLLKGFETDLKTSAAHGGGLVVNVTGLGGCFGLASRPDHFFAEAAGTMGVAKSAAHEWPAVTVRCIDLDPAAEAETAAARLREEIFSGPAVIETGIDKEGCSWKPELKESRRLLKHPDINGESVVLLLGGGSGITGMVAEQLARRYKSRLIVVGRTSPRGVFPPGISHLKSRDDLRDFFIAETRSGRKKTTPSKINREIGVILKQRALQKKLHEFNSCDVVVEYHALDVRDASALEYLLDDLYARYGRIDGVVHGAGIIEDSRIKDKTLDSFRKVYDTKVIPANVLARNLKPETLKFLVFFSSVAARFGNMGQYDYSSANEVLNKTALQLAADWPETRVVSIGWGPWDMGMVSDGLKNYYRKKGISLIPPDAGLDFFLNELCLDTDNSPEILVTSAIREISGNGLGHGRG
jgi:NAD(P)-dependent dehydrogenase (short-subunit alcohol dehydrogenase family)